MIKSGVNIESDLLGRYVDGFYGFGNLNARLWLIGLEEGGGLSRNEVLSRLNAWDRLGATPTVDCAKFHRETGDERLVRLVSPPAPRQPTWDTLQRVVWRSLFPDQPCDDKSLREWQCSGWGALRGQVGLLELMPLASKNIKPQHWQYAKYFPTVERLKDRPIYRRTVTRERVAGLARLIACRRPQVVAMYGTTATTRWLQVITRVGLLHKTTVVQRQAARWSELQVGTMHFLIVKHPTARFKAGEQHRYFGSLTERIKRLLHTG